MQARHTLILAAFLALMMAGSAAPALAGPGPGPCGGANITTLGVEEAEELTYMREEEKFARDVYLALYDIWQEPAFDKISQAEQKHMDALAAKIVKYGLVDPVVDDTPGVFTDPIFTTLYTDLVTLGGNSLVDALSVGALIEERDIVDLQDAIALTTHADLAGVYENLLCGSSNHLRCFAAELDALGEIYIAQYLTQAEFDAIADSPMERCGSRNFAAGKQKQVQVREMHQVAD